MNNGLSRINTAGVKSLALFLVLGCGSDAQTGGDEETPFTEPVSFNFDVKPILSDRCFVCHGPDENAVEADLRLHTEEGLFGDLGEEGDRHPVLPGRPAESEMYKRITSEDPEYMMPPPESNLALSEHEIAMLRAWIEQGAQWEPHWSFIPPERPALPEVRNEDWRANPIDHFVLKELDDQGLQPSPRAKKERLIRRVFLDLTGLPPTIDQVDRFVEAEEADAYEEVVDSLLDSSAFGERLASVWLDVARYADTHGYERDGPNQMWRWRDWVIAAFNENMPFDRFTVWQIAGDLLPNATPEQRLATGFNRVHQQNSEGGIIDEEFRIAYVKDRANTTGSAFLGLTFECASCHDHKYDPITQQEYYQFFAFFNNVNETLGRIPTQVASGPTILLPDDEEAVEIERLTNQIANLERKIGDADAWAQDAFSSWETRDHAPEEFLPDPEGLLAHLELETITDSAEVVNEVDGEPIGRVSGEPETVEGAEDGALEFSSSDILNLQGLGLFERTDPFSFAFWIRPASADTTGDVPIFTKGMNVNYGYRGYDVALLGERLSVRLIHGWPFNAIHIETEDEVPLDEWSHVSVTYDGSSRASGVRIYVNGHEWRTRLEQDGLFKNLFAEEDEPSLYIGRRILAQAIQPGDFEGLALDGVRIYERRLSAAEILALADPDGLAELLALAPEDRSPVEKGILFDHYLLHHDARYRRHEEDIRRYWIEKSQIVESVPESMVMEERMHPRRTFVLERGEYDNRGEEVGPGTPRSVLPFPEELPRNRLGLARWLVSPENPLTARVTVNRLWQMIFGTGLVDTPADFGNQGSLPSHPELLDWLAVSFITSGWDVKQLLKNIVMSATYQQDSSAPGELLERDPENRWLARGPRSRLTAEMIRDNVLSVSGLRVDRLGGPPVFPYQPGGLWPESSDSAFLGAYVQGEGESLYRRSIYTIFKRNQPPPSMTVFDHPVRDVSTTERATTSTPLQALVTWNDPQMVEAARALAERMMLEGGETKEERISFAFRAMLARQPRPAELSELVDLYEHQFTEYSENPEDAEELLQVGDRPADPSLPPFELAALATIASAIFNLYETSTKG